MRQYQPQYLRVLCSDCPQIGPPGATRVEAIAAWNTRAPIDRDEGYAREALQKALEFACLTLAFIGRDQGTERIDRTLDDLCEKARELDPLCRAALAGRQPDQRGGEVEREAAGALERERRYERSYWLIVREPGKVPDQCGPYLNGTLAQNIRDTIKHRPTAYIDVLTISYLGPDVQHGPEALQMLDGRSMNVGSKHNARVRQAHTEALAATPRPAEQTGEGE